MDIKTGQKVWLVEGGRNNTNNPIEKTVGKVGRKYFYLKDENYRKFYISNGEEFKDWGYKCLIYQNLQDILDEKELYILNHKLSEVFKYSYSKYDLETIRKVCKILSIEPDKKV